MADVTGSSGTGGTNQSDVNDFANGAFWYEWIELIGNATSTLSQAGFNTSDGSFSDPNQVIYNAGTTDTLNVPAQAGTLGNSGDDFGIRISTTLTVETAGTYDFGLNSDDGSILYVDGIEVVNYDGLHAASGPVAGSTFLAAGTYEIVIIHFERGGSESLSATISGPDYTGTVALENARVSANAADDTVDAGAGNDTIIGGDGNDNLSGGDGDDVIRGDSDPTGASAAPGKFEFSTITDPSGNGTTIDNGDAIPADPADPVADRTVNSTNGDLDVSITFENTGDLQAVQYTDGTTQLVDDLDNGAGTTNGVFALQGAGSTAPAGELGDTATAVINFASSNPDLSNEARDVRFRLNDIDEATFRDVVRIRAFDASGQPVIVNLTGGSGMTLTDTDGVAGNDTVTANIGSSSTSDSPTASLLVQIDGPVSSIEIEYGNLGPNFQRVDLTEIFYESIPLDGVNAFDDVIDGGAGNDTIFGDQGEDDITGGTGDDIIDGGTGNDTINGGDDNDTIIISSGTDTIDGGAGADTFDATQSSTANNETITVTVDENGDGTIEKTNDGTTDGVTSVETFVADEANAEADSIILTEGGLLAADISGIDDNAVGVFTPKDGSGPIAFGGPGQPTFSSLLAGTGVPGTSLAGQYVITSGDETGQVGGIAFENFETIDFSVVCFAAGTLIKTPDGLRPVDDLSVGDSVTTRDNGPQPIRWVGQKYLSAATLAANPNLQPIRIAKGALGQGTPSRDLIVSPQHRILVKSRIAIRMFETSEILVPAKHLLAMDGIEIATDLTSVTYVHIMCEDHEIILAEGALAETLYTGSEAMKAMSPDAKQEIAAIFADVPFMNRPLARLTPKGRQAKHLVTRHVKNDKALYSETI